MKNLKTSKKRKASSSDDIIALLEKRKNQIDDFFTSHVMDYDERNLREQITLGDKWDDPFAVMQALDEQPELYARWAAFKRDLGLQCAKLENDLKIIDGHIRLELSNWIFKKNIKLDMTANQAKPAKASLDEHMAKYIYADSIYKIWQEQRQLYHNSKKKLESAKIAYERAEIISDAFRQRKDMLQSLTLLMKSLIENNFLEVSRARSKKV